MAARGLARLPESFERIRKAARSPCLTVSLGALLRNTSPEFENRIASAKWLKAQLPTRFARRLEAFLQLPHVVICNENIHAAFSAHLETFEAVSAYPDIETEEHEAGFCDLMREQFGLHGPGTAQIAEGYKEVRTVYPEIKLDHFLEELFTARIATRILMENHVGMRSTRPGYLGVVKQDMQTASVVKEISNELRSLTRGIYGVAPEVIFRGNLDCTLDYIPRHVSYMVRELLKNALRANVEWHQAKTWSAFPKIPPVVVELQKGDVHVIIKISDQGGGMPKRVQREAWKYGWTTVKDEGPESSGEEPWNPRPSKKELAGYGFGLPLTRLHARYFGGDVFFQPLPGHGTDVYLLLTHLKAGTPSTEIDDLSTVLYNAENELQQTTSR
eukprot:TRINITY_DN32384_c0_g1_i2.p1 TRINITY_DN32384_c0_g1~~TRINITY_DN32384_c0_g1_i2.p1  ORF type:complete len:387 (-),score=65.23 TRINITY_DN32384_c0_g1_i2:20-1180(-)